MENLTVETGFFGFTGPISTLGAISLSLKGDKRSNDDFSSFLRSRLHFLILDSVSIRSISSSVRFLNKKLILKS